MWKFVTRGIRESIERRICRTNVYSQSSQDGTNNNHEQNQLVTVCERKFVLSKFSVFYQGCYGNTRHLGAKDKGNHNKYDAKYTWTDAVGWSSFLAVGYVVCQALCVHRKLFEIDNSNIKKWQNKLLSDPKQRVAQLLSQLLLPQPHGILPIIKQPIDIKTKDKTIIDIASSIELPFGPITAEEALQQALNQFSEIHNSTMGELESNFGSEAIKEERYNDAFEHFATGAKLSSTSSIFNLGLCYELGLGTCIDYEMAAKYYRRAADKGHVDAMYNLGIYHAQGKGGLEISMDAAHKLFEEAATKGHIKAQKALQLEKSFKKHFNLEQIPKNHLKAKTVSKSIENNIVAKLMDYNFLKTNSHNQYTEYGNFMNQYESDENVHSKSSSNIFFDMFNSNERSAMPFISVGESGP